MLVWVLMAGAALCLAYFIGIVLYSGIGTASAVIWLIFAAGLFLSGGCVRWYDRYPEKVPLRLPVALVTLCGAGVLVMLLLQILILFQVPSVAEPGLEYVIVLGSQIREGGPGKILRLRLDKAAEYARENPETTLILSGGQGEKEPEPEAESMKRYLLEQGVPERQLVLESQSSSTVENIAYSRLLIQKLREQRKGEGYRKRRVLPAYLPSSAGQGLAQADRIGILTSNFHLFRAMQIARKQGLGEVSGIASPSDRILFLHFCIRDGLAILKERLAGNL